MTTDRSAHKLDGTDPATGTGRKGSGPADHPSRLLVADDEHLVASGLASITIRSASHCPNWARTSPSSVNSTCS